LAVVFGQTASTPPRFEAADVHASAQTATPFARGPFLSGTRYDMRTATLVDLIVRALLADRFKLAAHFEERPTTAYTLTAPRPKLKQADPATRTKWTDSGGPIALNGSSVPSRTVKFQNMTMQQFADTLQTLEAPIRVLPCLTQRNWRAATTFG
jgi:hypothetical protein